MGSFCNPCDFGYRGERWTGIGRVAGEHRSNGVICLQRFQLAQGAMEGPFDAGFVAGEAIELSPDGGIVEEFPVGLGGRAKLGFHATNPEQVPGGGYQFIEHSLPQCAARVDFDLVIGAERFEFFAVLEGNEEFGGGEAVLARVLSRVRFAGFGARSGAELGERYSRFDLLGMPWSSTFPFRFNYVPRMLGPAVERPLS